MLDGGADPRYLARRIVRMAWEDIGLADPRAMQIANDAANTYERLGSPEGELALGQAVIYLAVAAKSNAGYMAYNAARAFVKQEGSRPVPVHLRNAPTKLMKELGYGKEYRYAHDEPEAYAAGETYLPDGMPEPHWYQPTPRGLEGKIGEKLAHLRELDRKAGRNNGPGPNHRPVRRAGLGQRSSALSGGLSGRCPELFRLPATAGDAGCPAASAGHGGSRHDGPG
jgi:putative ATPase